MEGIRCLNQERCFSIDFEIVYHLLPNQFGNNLYHVPHAETYIYGRPF
jgi:hypothetical protein